MPSGEPDRTYQLVWAATDEALVAGMAAGDEEAARAFVRRFQRRVFGLALAMLGGDVMGAEDVAQETFVRAWRHADGYDARRASVATWLLTIARHLAVDSLRVRRGRPEAAALERLLDLESLAPAPDELAVAGAEAERLREAVAALPAPQRRALVLAAFGGRSAREIAEIEGVPLGTAKTRIRAALLRLREALSGEREV